jgi:cellulose synthase/poly-beta-1,6-N-acetylglucosamine synthase-like glycosyltransferase
VIRPLVSVIVIGRNEGERLSQCLRSIRAMDFPQNQLEIIYVDSHSSDDSMSRAREQHVHTVALSPGLPTAARGRNEGSRLAKGDYLFFLDGDTRVAPQFLSHSLTYLQAHPEVAVYCGHRREVNPRQSIYTRVFDLDWRFHSGESEYCGGDAIIRKTVFDQVGGFRDDIICSEDAELCTRVRSAGYKIWRADELMTHHDMAITRFVAYWRRCYRGGHGYAEVADRSKGMLFRKESVKNHIQAGLYSLLPLGLIVIFGRRGLYAALVGASLIILFSAWRNRWRKASLITALLYAVHVHFCQFPIWLGQLAYLRGRRRKIARQIIEYK